MRTSVGIITFALGIALLVAARVERALVPAWMPRLAGAVTLLGASTLAVRRGGVGWTALSIALSAVSIGLLVSVIVDNLWRDRQRRP